MKFGGVILAIYIAAGEVLCNVSTPYWVFQMSYDCVNEIFLPTYIDKGYKPIKYSRCLAAYVLGSFLSL